MSISSRYRKQNFKNTPLYLVQGIWMHQSERNIWIRRGRAWFPVSVYCRSVHGFYFGLHALIPQLFRRNRCFHTFFIISSRYTPGHELPVDSATKLFVAIVKASNAVCQSHHQTRRAGTCFYLTFFRGNTREVWDMPQMYVITLPRPKWPPSAFLRIQSFLRSGILAKRALWLAASRSSVLRSGPLATACANQVWKGKREAVFQ